MLMFHFRQHLENLRPKFLLLCLDRYLFSVVSDNRYLPRFSRENVLSITITGDVTMSRQLLPVVAILRFGPDSLNSVIFI